jgi:hypothetical protein
MNEAAAVALALAAACSSPTTPRDTEPTEPAEAMNPRITSGPIPADLLPNRDRSPLPPDAVVKFQSIGRLLPDLNYRYVLLRDGSLFYAAHSGAPGDARVLFDTPLPAVATRKLSGRQVAAVEKALRKHRFVEQPPHQVDPQVQDGSIYVVTARVDGREHEVIYEAYAPPLVELLEELRTP